MQAESFRLLIVEDQLVNVKLLKNMLQHQPIVTEIASNGLEALQMVHFLRHLHEL